MLNPTILDANGFLKDPQQWTITIAREFAQQEALILTDDHWLVIYFVREFQARNHYVPTQRHIVKQLKAKLGAAKGSSLYLQQLFPSGPRQICLIAGLSKPARCL